MSIRPHPTNKTLWILDISNGRKGKRDRYTCTSYEQAYALQEALKHPSPASPIHPKIKDVIEPYLQWVADNQSADTYRNKERRFRRWIVPGLGEYRVKQLSQVVLDGYSKSMAAASYWTDLQYLHALIRWMVKRKYAEPLTFTPEAPKIVRKVKHIPDAAVIMDAINSIKRPMYRIAALFQLYSGLRPADIKRLRWEDYCGDKIIIQKTKTDLPFIVPVPDSVRGWMEENKKVSGYIFTINGIKPMTGLAETFREIYKNTGVKITPYLLRHAAATWTYEMTGDLYAAQHLLGHSRPSTTQIYTRYSDARRVASTQRLEDYVRRSSTDKDNDTE